MDYSLSYLNQDFLDVFAGKMLSLGTSISSVTAGNDALWMFR